MTNAALSAFLGWAFGEWPPGRIRKAYYPIHRRSACALTNACPSGFDLAPRIRQILKPAGIQALAAKPAMEALDELFCMGLSG